jgi:hypothetical protein
MYDRSALGRFDGENYNIGRRAGVPAQALLVSGVKTPFGAVRSSL